MTVASRAPNGPGHRRHPGPRIGGTGRPYFFSSIDAITMRWASLVPS